MLNLDLKALQEKMSNELAESTKSSSDESGYPLVYTGQNGKLTVRLLYNIKMGGLQKKIIRHASSDGKTKVACLQSYGEDCPICEAIKNVESNKGKESGVQIKNGYKIRGVCYAQIVDHEATYFTEENSPKKGDIVMLMYPKTVYDQLNKLIVDAGPNVAKILGSNSSIPAVIERTQKGKDFPKFTVSLYPYGESKAYSTDAEYESVLNELPNLAEAFTPIRPTEEVRTAAKALADAIMAENFGSQIVNPTIPQATVMPTPKVVTPLPETDELPFDMDMAEPTNVKKEPVTVTQVVEEVVSKPNTSGKPNCFAHHDDNSDKCSECKFECDCVMAME
jgi:hypothetical protein